jgi:hypothetical protein
MSNTKRTSPNSKKKNQWYDVGVVVELLINETPRGEKYAPEIGNLCIGFTSLSIDKLEDEIEEMRTDWPFVFPRTVSTGEILKLIKKKYPAYEEILTVDQSE